MCSGADRKFRLLVTYQKDYGRGWSNNLKEKMSLDVFFLCVSKNLKNGNYFKGKKWEIR